MSIHTRGPFSWAGGPIGHTSANAGVAAIAAAVPSMARREMRVEISELLTGIVFPKKTRLTEKGRYCVSGPTPNQYCR